jgi:hypothetical protein
MGFCIIIKMRKLVLTRILKMINSQNEKRGEV